MEKKQQENKYLFPQDENESSSFSLLEEKIGEYSTPLLELCIFAEKNNHKGDFPCRSFLRHFNMESSRIEELLDIYGASKNEWWFPFRESVAAGKTFSSVMYTLLHVKNALELYKIRDMDGNFERDTENVVACCKKAVVSVCGYLLKQAEHCGVYRKKISVQFEGCMEEIIPVRLPEDRKVRHVDKIGEVIVYLSSQFLNLSEEGSVQDLMKERTGSDLKKCIPDVVNEEKCRLVETSFHNLESLYDTYLFESDIEKQNDNFLYLKGHISTIFHLMQMTTELIHFYIRHMSKWKRISRNDISFPIAEHEILSISFDYFLRYAYLYLESGKHLCHTMIQHYSHREEVEVEIPNYRGFHVRPSTLISKIVNHYGSDVKMILDGEEYDAGVTLDLFRANEAINAMKRRQVAEILRREKELQMPVPDNEDDRIRALKEIFLNLLFSKDIILYDTNLPFDDLDINEQETMLTLVSRFIMYFMSVAKLDVRNNLTIKFSGDNRAINDIKILSEHGYGEDRYGNNIELPQELAYLRK